MRTTRIGAALDRTPSTRPPKPPGINQNIPVTLYWQPSWMYEFGVTRYFDNGWHASAGCVYNENSVPNANYTPSQQTWTVTFSASEPDTKASVSTSTLPISSAMAPRTRLPAASHPLLDTSPDRPPTAIMISSVPQCSCRRAGISNPVWVVVHSKVAGQQKTAGQPKRANRRRCFRSCAKDWHEPMTANRLPNPGPGGELAIKLLKTAQLNYCRCDDVHVASRD